MRAALFLSSLLGLGACTSHNAQELSGSITCASNQTAVYANRFSSMGGGSGVATPSDAAAGLTNSAPTAQPAAPDDSTTAMTATCGPSQCDPGQVAVQIDATPVENGGVTGAPVASDDSSGGSSPTPTSGIASPPASGAPAQSTAPTFVCAPPPPDCPSGQSPQYTDNGKWDCTDCALVVTYGSIYGNSRRCVSAPTIDCNNGDVPTWSYDDDQWECQPECDNGNYDQHVIAGQTVCVPC